MPTLASNRTAKALRIADAIRSLPDWPAWVAQQAERVVDTVAAMPVKWWADIADLAGTKPPSVDTQQVVVTILRDEFRGV